MMKKYLKKPAFLCMALLLVTAAVSCGGKATYAPGVTEPVTLPDMADDRVLPDDVIEAYEEKLEAAFGNYEAVPAQDLTYQVSEDGTEVLLTGYTGSELVVILPDTVDGLPVTAVAEDAFKGMGNMKALYIPDSVQAIGFGALKGCKSLSTLRTPVVEVAAHPYFGALFGAASYEINAAEVPDALTTLIVGGAVEQISDYAFFDCNSITCISLPDTLKTIGKFAFWGCASLEYLNLSETALETVGDRALTNCAALLRFDLPVTVTSVGEAVVEGCGALCAMTLPFVGGSVTENTYLGYLFGALSYTFTAGYVPASLQEITLLEGCTAIPNNAFFEVSCLSRVIIPDTVTSVGLRAFYGCERLTSITLPDRVTAIGDDAFHGCIRLQSVDLGDGLTDLGVQAFMDCLTLKTVDLPASLSSIPNSCFAGCVSLETVTAPGVTSADHVGLQAYRHCDKLTQAPFMPVETQVKE